jgi:outer membrane lipoprotein-sorting protein
MRLLFALAVFVVPVVAYADAPGDTALAGMEAATNRARSSYFEYEVRTQERGKAERVLGMNVWEKGEKRLTEFTSPADMKGTKVLVLSPTEMYVYLPAFGKVRRIASHTSDQAAFGMAFSQEDLAATRWSNRYTAQIGQESATAVRLALTPRAGQTTSYSKIEITVAKDRMVPTELRYTSGAQVKTETRSGYTCEGNVCAPGTRTMVGGSVTTTLVRKKWKVNESIGDDVFSKRNLER